VCVLDDDDDEAGPRPIGDADDDDDDDDEDEDEGSEGDEVGLSYLMKDGIQVGRQRCLSAAAGSRLIPGYFSFVMGTKNGDV